MPLSCPIRISKLLLLRIITRKIKNSLLVCDNILYKFELISKQDNSSCTSQYKLYKRKRFSKIMNILYYNIYIVHNYIMNILYIK